MKKTITKKRKPLISALEPRILFDGAAVTTAVDVLDNSSYDSTDNTSTDSTDSTDNSSDSVDVAAVQSAEKDKKEVAFVDSSVDDYETLVEGIDSDTTVYVVDSLDEIKDILSTLDDVDAIHILSHGDTGEITVGEDVLNSDSLDTYNEVLEAIKDSLSEDGDLLLYGCNVASDGEGQDFIDSLAEITEADVAASDDVTGSSDLGGDWDLEASSGVIDTDAFEIDAYTGTLDGLEYVDLSNWSATGSGTWVLLEGNRTVFQIQNVTGNYISSEEYIDTILRSTIYQTDSTYTINGDSYVTNFANDNDQIGYILGYQDSSNYVLIEWRGSDSGSSAGIYLYQVTNGSRTLLDSLVGSSEAWSKDTLYTFEILYMNDSIKVNIDGTTVLSYSGTANQFSSGQVGFYMSSQGGVEYGNVQVAAGSSTDVVPTLGDDTYGVDVNSSLTEDRFDGILANDYDANLDEYSLKVNGTTLSSTSSSTTFSTSHGQITVYGDGSFTYTPEADYTGYDSFTYTLIDNDGESNTATVTFVVQDTNQAPTDITPSSTSFNYNVSDGDVVATLTTTDPNPYDVHDYLLIDNANGAFGISDNKIVINDASLITPGTYTITVRTVDLRGLTYDEEITFTVYSTPPTVTEPSTALTINEDTAYTFSASEFSTDYSYNDADGDAFGGIEITSLPSNGTLTLNGSSVSVGDTLSVSDLAKLVYTPASNYNGNDTFQFKALDSTGAESSAVDFDIVINAVNDAPTASSKTITIDEDSTYTLLSTDFNYSDVEGDTLEVIITSLPSDGTLEYYNGSEWVEVTTNQSITTADIANGYLRYTPATNENGTSYSSFNFKVNDGTTDSASTYTMTFDVTSIEDIPTAADNTITIDEDTTYTLTQSDLGYFDGDSDSLVSITIGSISGSGTFEYSSDGTTWTTLLANQTITAADIIASKVRFTPAENEYGSSYSSFTFTVNDGKNDSTSSYTITFDVTSVNDAPVFGAEDDDTSNGSNTSSTVKQIFDNADFEDGLSGWTTNGNATAVDSDTLNYNINTSKEMTDEVKDIIGDSSTITWTVDSDGTGMVKLEASGSSSEFDSTFQDASHVSDETMDYISDTFYESSSKEPTNVAYITKTFYAEAGDTYSIAWNYISSDYMNWNDGSILTFVNDDDSSSTAVLDGVSAEVVLLGATNYGTGNYTTGSYGSTGWQTTTIQVLESGTYTLTIAVFNLGDTALNPYLYVDNITGTTTLNDETFDPLDPDVNAPEAAGDEFIVESGLTETDSSVSSSGTMSVTDVDTSDTVSVYTSSVTTTQKDSSGNEIDSDTEEPSLEELLSMMSISPTDVIDSSNTSGTFTWTFDSGTEAFDYLEEGETLTLTYTFVADDGNGGLTEQTLDVVITGSNDAPSLDEISDIEITNNSNDTETFDTVTGTLNATDVDDNDLTYTIIDDSSQSVQTIVGDYGTFTLDSSTGEYSYVPNADAINALMSDATETFTIQVTDAYGDTATETLTIEIPYINEMPLLGGDSSTVTFTENGSAVQIDSTITITDPEGADFDSGYIVVEYTSGNESDDTLSILNTGGITVDRGNVYYAGILIGTVDADLDGEDGNSLKINLNSNAYSEQVQALARAIAYSNDTDDLSDTSREVTFKINDGGDEDNTARYSTKTATIDIVTINDLPEITLSNSTYLVEKVIGTNDDGTLSLTNISFSDADGDTLTVTFETTEYGTITIDDSVTGGVSSSNITGNGTTSVTISGTIDEINTTLAATNGIVYTAGSGNDYVTPGADYLKVTAVDSESGETVTTKEVMVLPAVPNAYSDNIITKEDTSITVDVESLVADINDNAGTFTFGSSLNASISSATQIVDALEIYYNEDNEAVGFVLDHGILLLTDSSTVTETNGVVTTTSAQFTYIPTDDWSGVETFYYQYESGDNTTSSIAQINIFVTAVNDTPTVTITDTSITLDEDTTYTFDSSNTITLADIEDTGSETFQLTLKSDEGILSLSTTSGLTIIEGSDDSSSMTIQGSLADLQAALDSLTYTPNQDYNGTDYITVSFSDLGNTGSGGTLVNTQTIDVTINPVNDAPIISVSNTSSTADESDVSVDGKINFVDVDTTDTPTITSTLNSITAMSKDGTTVITLTNAQKQALSEALSLTISSGNTNVGTATWNYIINETELDFLGKDDTLTLSYNIEVTDDSGATDSQDITITITGTNDTPTVSTLDIDEEINFGVEYNYDFSTLFDDLDVTDTFTYSVDTLPQGLTLDPVTGIISGTVSESGPFTITVTATDSNGSTAQKTFEMLVIAPPQVETGGTEDPTPKDTNDGDGDDITGKNKEIKEENGVEDKEVETIIDEATEGEGESGNDDFDITQTELTDVVTSGGKNVDDKLISANVGLNVATDGSVGLSDDAKEAFETVGLTIEDIDLNDNYIEIKIIDSKVGQKYVATLADGSDLPKTLSFDPNTGIVRGTLPDGLEELDISIKALSSDGTTRVLTIKIDVNQLRANENNEAKYETLSDQVTAQNEKMNSYGDFIVSLFDSQEVSA